MVILNHFNFVVNKGEKVAIVGATGSGKTTIVNLLTRFYELDEGGISIGTIDITSVPKRILRKEIGIVLQDTVLFHDTIRNNIRFGNREASNSMIEQAAELAMADRFIRQLPDGFETILQESGENLSEGQRQIYEEEIGNFSGSSNGSRSFGRMWRKQNTISRSRKPNGKGRGGYRIRQSRYRVRRSR